MLTELFKQNLKGCARPVLRRIYHLAIIALIPLTLTSRLWMEVWQGVAPRAANGSGHYALAQLYDSSVFPDTFGWTNAYFAGMPFPNFYPPLFYWCVAALHHLTWLSFGNAFKISVVLPLVLLPLGVCFLSWSLSGKDRTSAVLSALATYLLLFVPQFQLKVVSGLDYYSTLVFGLYTQPLGFVLLLAWYAVYLSVYWSARRKYLIFIAATFLLALTALANFFNAAVSLIFIVLTAAHTLWSYVHTADSERRAELKFALVLHLLSPLLAFALTLFWVVPMISNYAYLVTRPLIIPLNELVPRMMLGWYFVAALGLIVSFRPSAATGLKLFSGACVLMAGSIIFAEAIGPRWFPLQSYRFLSTLDFLLAVPVGRAVKTLADVAASLAGKISFHEINLRSNLQSNEMAASTGGKSLTLRASALLALILFGLSQARTPAPVVLTYYQKQPQENISDVLAFAREHRDARFFVELPDPLRSYPEAGYDSRAISAYLGAQGNEALAVVFREASPSALFVNPQTNALSTFHDLHGISSLLAEDQDFLHQPLSAHLARISSLGAKYLVIASPEIKQQLNGEAQIKERYDYGAWSVFVLRDRPQRRVRALAYKPALLLSRFSVKARRGDESSFISYAEQQFADNWFNVLLVRSPQEKLDKLEGIEGFGPLIVDAYQYDNEDAAYARLKELSQTHTVILLSSPDSLYARIKNAAADFPSARFIERPETLPVPVSQTVSSETNSLKKQWQSIRSILETTKTPVNAHDAAMFTGLVEQNAILIDGWSAAGQAPVPVLIETTYSPNWRRSDDKPVYAATPFYMLTFVERPIELAFSRSRADRAALIFSATVLLSLCLYPAVPLASRRWRRQGFSTSSVSHLQ